VNSLRWYLVIAIGLFLLSACESGGNEETAETLQPTTASQPTATTAPLPTETTMPVPAEQEPTSGTADADVIYVRAVESEDGRWTIHVTVSHPDTGWEDYADGWDVVTPDGTVLKRSESDTFTRLLLHPHEAEQPFTRSQSGLIIPEGVTQVTVRAHDLLDGFGGKEVVVDLTAESGPDFEIESN
jgi:hypothetical protein